MARMVKREKKVKATRRRKKAKRKRREKTRKMAESNAKSQPLISTVLLSYHLLIRNKHKVADRFRLVILN